MRRLKTALALAGLAVAAAQPGRADQAGPERRPTFPAEVADVEVDATVTDAQGRFVRGLTRDDFELLEDGAPQTLATFSLVDLPVDVKPAVAAPTRVVEPDVQTNEAVAESRLFVLVLDDLHVDPAASARARELARRFVERYVGTPDFVAVLYTSGRADAGQELTRNRAAVLGAIDRFAGRRLRSATLERLDAYERDPETQSRADQRMQQIQDPLAQERARDTDNTLRALGSLGDLLGRTRGRRKAVLLVSQGIDYELQNSVTQTASGISTATNADSEAIASRLRIAIASMTRADVAIYGIDPSGLSAGGDDAMQVRSFPDSPLLGLTPGALQDESQRAQDSLRILADETGGATNAGSNDFDLAFSRILQDNSRYYVLSYHSTNAALDGRYRRIELRVKRPGLKVKARKGYVAPLARDAAKRKPADPLLDSALPRSGMPLRAFSAPFLGTGGRASVLFGVEADAGRFTFGAQGGVHTDTLDAAVIAVDGQGRSLKGDNYSVALKLSDASLGAVQQHGVRLLFRLGLEPGRYQLRAIVAESGAASTVHYDLVVPDFRAEPLSLSGLVLTSSDAGLTPTPRADPDLAALVQNPPTGARDFRTTETLVVVFALYRGLKTPPGAVDVVTTVRDADGGLRFRNEMQVSEADQAGSPDGLAYLVSVPLSEIGPGACVLDVEAKPRSGTLAPIARSLPFTILPEPR